VIDLVIPRGSKNLISQIKASTKIPVLGHAGKLFFIIMLEQRGHI
jgi:gamma-glutamyl phosphate reductase